MSPQNRSSEESVQYGATHALATLALEKASEATLKVEGHEALCAERYDHIRTSISGVKESVSSIMKVIVWGGGILATILISLVGFFGARAISVNDAEVARLRAQVTMNSQRLQQSQGEQGLQGVQGVQGIQGVSGGR